MKKSVDVQTDEYAQRIRCIGEVVEKPALARVFYLIIDGVNYNKKLAEVYYGSGRNVRMKTTANPKVLAIYLKSLSDAGLIRKMQKDGRIQYYDVDWKGLLYSLKACNQGFLEFGGAYFNSIGDYLRFKKVTDTNKELIVENVEKFYVENFIRPYFLKRKEELKLAFGYLKSNGKKTSSSFRFPLKKAYELREKHGNDFCTIPKDFDNVDFGLKQEFKVLNQLILGPYYYNREIVEEFLCDKTNKNLQLYWLFNFIKTMSEDYEYQSINQEDSRRVVSDKVIKILKNGV